MNSLILIGLPGVGKSYVGSLLAKSLGLSHIDLDDELKKILKSEIQPWVEINSLSKFRVIEEDYLLKNLEKIGENRVISFGGGTLTESDSNIITSLKLEKFTIIYLKDDIINIKKRIISDASKGVVRPVVKDINEDELEYLIEKRKAFYEELSSIELKVEEDINKTLISIKMLIKGI